LALTPGARLGPFEITTQLGVGGMGEVYRATDTNLKRQVAIKVLPASVASDPERLARFQREAEVLAALNHPNIAHIHGLEKSDGTIALVMELVEGPTLADRIAQGAIPLGEALPIAKQIAEALEAAHEHGIIHRDLKPANIKVRSDGAVKVLDFGLAKAIDPVGAARANLSMSPTITTPAMTHAGLILGTAAYMAPEQARGKPVDKRADIWAFGCVLYEMLTGERLFRGEDLTETLASVVKEQPDISQAPRHVQRLLRKCLEKDPRKRLRDIGDAWDLIDDDISDAHLQSIAGRRWIPWSVAGILAIALLATLSVAYVRARPTGAPGHRVHVSMLFPNNAAPGFIALSPDGRMLAYTINGKISVRSLETGDVKVLPGMDTARAPFWSPDSRTIAYFSFTERTLKTIAVSGGVPRILCTKVGGPNSGTWNRDGTILFNSDGRLMRTSVGGAACTTVDAPRERRFPVFLPDGDHSLNRQYGPQDADTGLMVSSLRDGTTKQLLGDATGGMFAPDAEGSTHGRLLFIRDRTLMAQPFDAGSLDLSGDPTPVSSNASVDLNGQIAVSLATDGTLVFVAGRIGERELAWYDRSGAEIGQVTGTGYQWGAPSLSSDGKRLLFVRVDDQARPLLWMHDVESNQERQLTAPGLLGDSAAVWSLDGTHVVFGGGRASGNDRGLFDLPVSSGVEHLMLRRDGASPSDRTPDGHWLIYTAESQKTGADIWAVPYPSNADAAKPVSLLQTPARESQAQVSPDGTWIAYTSDESQGLQVWVRPFAERQLAEGEPLPDTKWQVSSSPAGGREPRWRADGKELFYLEATAPASRTARLMTVAVGTGVDPFGPPKPLFSFPTSGGRVPQVNIFLYTTSRDGQRFLVNRDVTTDVQPTVEMIVNWASTK
jgi:serine/threonine protein kinase/Tol biopolymer transport system component